MPTRDIEGHTRLVPHNLITAWYWVTGGPEPRPVRMLELQAALLAKAGYHPDVLKVLDSNGDGQVTSDEQRLDTPEKVEAVRRRLTAVGVEQPRIEAEIQPYSLHHGIGPKRWATRDCQACHAAKSRLTEPFLLAAYRCGKPGTERRRKTMAPDSALSLLVAVLCRVGTERQSALAAALPPYTFTHGQEAWLTILIGFLFGFVLERAGFGNARNLAAQFYRCRRGKWTGSST